MQPTHLPSRGARGSRGAPGRIPGSWNISDRPPPTSPTHSGAEEVLSGPNAPQIVWARGASRSGLHFVLAGVDPVALLEDGYYGCGYDGDESGGPGGNDVLSTELDAPNLDSKRSRHYEINKNQ